MSIINERTAASSALDRGVAVILQALCDGQGDADDTAGWDPRYRPRLPEYLQRYDHLDWLTFGLIHIIIPNDFCFSDFEICAESRTKC